MLVQQANLSSTPSTPAPSSPTASNKHPYRQENEESGISCAVGAGPRASGRPIHSRGKEEESISGERRRRRREGTSRQLLLHDVRRQEGPGPRHLQGVLRALPALQPGAVREDPVQGQMHRAEGHHCSGDEGL